MIEQQYYRLGELNRTFGLSLEYLRYMVENDQIRLLFKTAHAKYLIGLISAQSQFSGFGSAYYSGFISITKADQLTLITKNKVHCSKMWLLQQSNIKRLDDVYPYKLSPPNQYVQEWIEKDCLEASDNVWAIPYLTEHNGLGRGIVSLIADLAGTQVSESDAAINKLPEYTLTTSPLILTHDDICISRQALIRLGIVNDEKVNAKTQPDKSRTENASRSLVQNLIKLYPTLGASALWDYLRKNHEEDESLDPESIICEVGRDELTWVDGTNTEKTMTKKRFRNMVSEEKNK